MQTRKSEVLHSLRKLCRANNIVFIHQFSVLKHVYISFITAKYPELKVPVYIHTIPRLDIFDDRVSV